MAKAKPSLLDEAIACEPAESRTAGRRSRFEELAEKDPEAAKQLRQILVEWIAGEPKWRARWPSRSQLEDWTAKRMVERGVSSSPQAVRQLILRIKDGKSY